VRVEGFLKILQVVRYLLALALTFWALLIMVPNPFLEAVDECSTSATKTQEGSTSPIITAVTRTCNGPEPSSVLPFALVVALLVLPEISEIAIPGILSLKRKVEEQQGELANQASRQEQLETQYNGLQQQLNLVSFQASNAMSVSIFNTRESVEAKRLALTPAAEAESQLGAAVQDERAKQLDELREAASALTECVNYAMGHQESDNANDVARSRWLNLFRPEITEVLASGKQAIDHPFSLKLPELQVLIETTRQLVKVYEQVSSD
jgi:hypothetical protein